MHSTVRILLLLLSVALATAAHAVQPNEVLSDPALESRARGLSANLRCLVCQNQSIDDSDAPLARDLRLLVRERLVAGDSDAEVTRFLVARYGEFVLLRPPFGWHTLMLWLTPVLLLTLAVGGIGWRFARARGQHAAPAQSPLTADEQKRLASLLKDTTSRN
jgi:cytochrome c-type biogenesis protein CcmH